ncbi:thioredoxin-related transmembrane protein 2 homolog [Galendromus occidentalis]|uniref:Thioredoxin-related transmembrane protein 2 homolog n=1 Tax=Galendromus occidentalis TaxID=34638 RepID=A0AAJ6QV70_9ACAR|nr:thioredoxin-related transmembrane protein 2 homolog [Galendromus occidentalis]
MAIVEWCEVQRLFHPHYLLTVILATIFFPLRICAPVCEILFPDKGCQLDYRETEILFFLIIVILFRTRKLATTSLVPYVSAASMYTKVAMVILFFYNDVRYGIIYSIVCIVHLMVFPEPTYSGPDVAVYFTSQTLEEELQKDKRVVWIVEFFALWSPPCINFASDFRRISAKYTLENLRFGKIDVTRNPEAAAKYHINTSALSKQLPTLIMFKDGKALMRRPTVDSKSKLVKFNFCIENIVNEFDLNNLYNELKNDKINKKAAKQEGSKKTN